MPNTEMIAGMAFVGVFILIWCSVSLLSAKFGRWNQLASKYAATGIPTGKMYRFQSAKLGNVKYKNALNLHVSSRGLYMVPMVLFRFGHPPVLVPWRNIRLEQKKEFFGFITILHIGNPVIAKMNISDSLVERSGMRQYVSRLERR